MPSLTWSFQSKHVRFHLLFSLLLSFVFSLNAGAQSVSTAPNENRLSPAGQMTVQTSGLNPPALKFIAFDFPKASATNPGSINARGDIVGNYHDANGVVHGFLLRQGVFFTIDFPNAQFTSARAINARGDIVGRVLGPSGDEHGFLLRDGIFTQIDYPGASATTARGINNDGDITGRHFDSAGNESGFILKDGEFHNVFFPGSCSTDVWSAMDNEQVLVGDIPRTPTTEFTVTSESSRVISAQSTFPVRAPLAQLSVGSTSGGTWWAFTPTVRANVTIFRLMASCCEMANTPESTSPD